MPKERTSKYLAPGTPAQEIEILLLRLWSYTVNGSGIMKPKGRISLTRDNYTQK